MPKIKFNNKHFLGLLQAEFPDEKRLSVKKRIFMSDTDIKKGQSVDGWIAGRSCPNFECFVKIMRYFGIEDIEEFVIEK
jgi:hypothetical protein